MGIEVRDQPSGGFIDLRNATGSGTEFAPLLQTRSIGASRPFSFQNNIAAADDTGTAPLITVTGRVDNGAVTTRPIFEVRNNTARFLTVLSAGYTGINNTSPRTGLTVGSNASFTTIDPKNQISLGGGFSANAGFNPKLVLWESNTTPLTAYYGLGVSDGQLDYIAGQTNGKHAFFCNPTGATVSDKVFEISSAGITGGLGKYLRLAGSTSGMSTLVAAATGPTIIYTLPAAAPPVNQATLTSTTTGALSWTTPLRAYSGTADIVTVFGTTTQTPINNLAVNTLKVGSTFKFRASGVLNKTSATNSSFSVVFNSSLGALVTVTNVVGTATYTDRPFLVEGTFTVRTTGAPGTGRGEGSSLLSGNMPMTVSSLTDTSINTTLATNIALIFSTSEAATVMTVTNWLIEEVL